MKLDPHPPRTAIDTNAPALLDPVEVINAMINLRFQLAELEAQIQAIKPAFFAACVALNTEKITLEQAIVSRRLTPGKWAYPPDIVQQEDLLKQHKHQFEQEHEPISGREVIWVIKLLLATA